MPGDSGLGVVYQKLGDSRLRIYQKDSQNIKNITIGEYSYRASLFINNPNPTKIILVYAFACVLPRILGPQMFGNEQGNL